ncbi:GNAT family N-acetyltransferase [Treponema parvum]|uniref:GNAT family N-acetyltransferase n=1 Tax=Treponema parvum TaxID=138851 RepID=A0A975F2K6_9SPIR|nr:GNAT family N-acetyltransferase [Treponema parvum]QTQ13391.1 GNAT family N-acetyltransferase [Treponema parvum]
MYFELTESIANSILAAMEDQNSFFVLDAVNGILIKKEQNTVDNDRYFFLPQWTSADGFALREQFVSDLHAPLIKDELRQILHSGRGVFKNFKTCIRQYPEIEKKWHLFKHYKMRRRLNEWYNSLREIWGLEKLAQDAEDFEIPVQNDFIFCAYDSSKDKNLILRYSRAAAGDMDENLPEEISTAFVSLWKYQFKSHDSEIGFICRTFSDEFAGCITFSQCPFPQGKTVVLTSFFVLQNFRGLGIGKELLSLSLEDLQKRNIQWVIIANIVIPDIMIPLLHRFGFEKTGSGYTAKLF